MKKYAGNFLLFVFMCIIGFGFVYVLFQKKPSPQPTVPPVPSAEDIIVAPTFSLDTPPKQSLAAAITSLSGDVVFTSRTATEPAQLKENTIITQGESVETKKDGALKMSVGTELSITLFSDSKLQFIQTLPTTIVFQQDTGSVTYSKTPGSPVSIRAFGLSTQLTDGRVLISIDPDRAQAVIKIQKGSATFAYNDVEYQSHVATFEIGSILVYDSDKRTLSEE
jgi:hypothetical protein